MADLLALLQQGSQGLAAHRNYSATASHNIQNVNTPGYARQRVDLAAVIPAEFVGGGFIGRGVVLQSVTQARDRFIERQIPAALAQSGASTTETAVLRAVNALNPDGGLPTEIGAFYGSLRALAQNPGDAGLRQAVVGRAQSMALAFNRTAQGLSEARTGVDGRLGAAVEEANALAGQLASLNRQIHEVKGSGSTPNDLLDARQRVQDRLVAITGATVVPNANGDVNLQLPQGQTLVAGYRHATLSVLPDPANNGHMGLRYTSSDGNGPTVLANSTTGELGGLLSARDGALKDAQSALDTMAYELAGGINASHAAGYGLDGGTGRDLFDRGTTAAGAASRLQLNALIKADPSLLATASAAADLPGDASNLHQTIATESELLTTSGKTATNTLAQIITEFGNSAQRIESIASHDEATVNHLNKMRESVSGVSLDEEMVNLTRAQRAFEAVAKVMQTTNEMLDTLMSLR